MGISKTFEAIQAKKEIEQMLTKRVNNDYLRNDCGKILNDLGRRYGYDVPNQIIQELNLDKTLNLQLVCPATDALNAQKNKK
jgi:hypothetical protein